MKKILNVICAVVAAILVAHYVSPASPQELKHTIALADSSVAARKLVIETLRSDPQPSYWRIYSLQGDVKALLSREIVSVVTDSPHRSTEVPAAPQISRAEMSDSPVSGTDWAIRIALAVLICGFVGSISSTVIHRLRPN